MLWSLGLGAAPYALGQIAPSFIYAALLVPLVLAVVAFRCLIGRPFRFQLFWGTTASVATTAVLSAIIAGIGFFKMSSIEMAFGLVPAPFWLPWLLLFTITPLLVHQLRLRSPKSLRWLIVPASLLAFYCASFALCFDFSRHTQPSDVEQRDESGREPALGPRVSSTGRLICPPEGPSFLFSADYANSEWIWTIYSPLIHAWFAFPGRNYYHPYSS